MRNETNDLLSNMDVTLNQLLDKSDNVIDAINGLNEMVGFVYDTLKDILKELKR